MFEIAALKPRALVQPERYVEILHRRSARALEPIEPPAHPLPQESESVVRNFGFHNLGLRVSRECRDYGSVASRLATAN